MNARTERRSAIETECYERLRTEFLDALTTDPQRIISTPAFGPNKYTAEYVLIDSLSGVPKPGAVNPAHILIGILAAARNGEDVQLRSTLFLDVESRKHAEHHLEAMVVELMGDEVEA